MSDAIIVFTDLDGTLLNHHDYDWSAAKPALAELRKRKIPLMLVSSKTDVEMLALRRDLGNTDPLVCENGSLVLIPEALLKPLGIEADPRAISDGYYYDYRGLPREQLLGVLNELKPDHSFTGFAWMTVEEVAQHTDLSLKQAELAGQRKASEPILWRDSPEALDEFKEELAKRKMRLVEGGRFYHVMGSCDKGDAVRSLRKHYAHYFGTEPFSIALGDSPNDLDMLTQVDAPAIIPHSDGPRLTDSALSQAFVAPKEGAAGWNEAVLTLIKRRK